MRTLKILIGVFVFAFVLPSQIQAGEKKQYLLVVDINKRQLIVYLTGDKEMKMIAYPIAVPQKNWLSLPLIGEVKEIELNPWWYPTEKTRIAYFKRKKINLPKVIPPGDPRNAMGKAKIKIRFENFNAPLRIHGTNEPNSIGQQISRGCIRMHNDQILELAKIIRGSETKVIFR